MRSTSTVCVITALARVTANAPVEVQDQRLMDIELFLSLVKDSRGFHFGQ